MTRSTSSGTSTAWPATRASTAASIWAPEGGGSSMATEGSNNNKYPDKAKGPTTMATKASWVMLLAGILPALAQAGCTAMCSCREPPATAATGATSPAGPTAHAASAGASAPVSSVPYQWKHVVL